MKPVTTPSRPLLPNPPVRRWTRPFARFLQIEAASGFVLLACTVLALAMANSPWSAAYHQFWHTHISLTLGAWRLDESLAHWVNDALMVVFFFVVGLEIKREIVAGELRDARKAALPVMAALGGMIVPAAIYYALQHGQPGERGWGIPMATDIAFVVGIMAVLGPRVPLGLKILVLALAIADDIGAVLVIALFYSTDISLVALAWGAGGLVLTLALRLIGVRSIALYVLIGASVWLAFLLSGIHPTIAGVVLGLMTPTKPWIGRQTLQAVIAAANDRIGDWEDDDDAPDRDQVLWELQTAAREASSPLHRLESALHAWVAFGVMPLFALANAGVAINGAYITDGVAQAVAAGLFLGKPLGIFVFSWIAVRLGITRLPAGVNWPVLFAAGCLAGIGFTMSLFVASLALEPEQLEAGKLGTLAGSTLSALVGGGLLLWLLPRQQRSDAT